MGEVLPATIRLIQTDDAFEFVFTAPGNDDAPYGGDDEIRLTPTGADWAVDYVSYDASHERYEVIPGRSLTLFKDTLATDGQSAELLSLLQSLDDMGRVQSVQMDLDGSEWRFAVTLNAAQTALAGDIQALNSIAAEGVNLFFDSMALAPLQPPYLPILWNRDPEGQVRQIFAALKSNPQQTEISFNSKLYRFGTDQVAINSEINEALRDAGSPYRIFQISEDNTHTFAYGDLAFERALNREGMLLWEMVWDTVREVINPVQNQHRNLALTDTHSFIVVLKENIREAHRTAGQSLAPVTRKNSWFFLIANHLYRVQQAANQTLQKSPELSVDATVSGALAHERYHLVFSDRYDLAFKRWIGQIAQRGTPEYYALYALMEMRCDLENLDHIIQLEQVGRRSEASAALSGFLLYNKGNDLFSAFFLPSLSVSDAGNLEVDWKQLAQDCRAFADLLDRMFSSLSQKFYLASLGLVKKKGFGFFGTTEPYDVQHADDLAALKQEYRDVLKDRMRQQTALQYPDASQEELRRKVDQSIVDALQARPPIEVKQEVKEVWDWVKEKLGAKYPGVFERDIDNGK